MGKLFVKDRAIVVPGEVLAEGMDFLPVGDVVRENELLIATKVGLVNVSGRFVKVIPLTGGYVPKERDIVIGKVVGMGFYGWRVDIGWAYEAVLSLKEGTQEFVEKITDLSKYYNFGDYVVAQIIGVNGAMRMIDLTAKGPGLRKLGPGRLINVSPSKVPRIIGKQGSMVSMIKQYTGCRISVGQNGLVWIGCDDPVKEMLAIKAIRKIEEESHFAGLTDKIKEMLEHGV